MNDAILTCRHGDFSWIRCDGKGSFANSKVVKQFAEDEINAGGRHIVMDLVNCTGMDSTFMGTMAGVAMKIAEYQDGVFDVARPNERTRASLEDLGLGVLMRIDPEDAAWREQLENIEKQLQPAQELEKEESLEKAQHVLECHEDLCKASPKNTAKFSDVLKMLDAEVKAKELASKD